MVLFSISWVIEVIFSYVNYLCVLFYKLTVCSFFYCHSYCYSGIPYTFWILSRPGIKAMAPAVEARNLNH